VYKARPPNGLPGACGFSIGLKAKSVIAKNAPNAKTGFKNFEIFIASNCIDYFLII
jgi:hypothetical protein